MLADGGELIQPMSMPAAVSAVLSLRRLSDLQDSIATEIRALRCTLQCLEAPMSECDAKADMPVTAGDVPFRGRPHAIAVSANTETGHCASNTRPRTAARRTVSVMWPYL